jgi:GTP-binding protein HflX
MIENHKQPETAVLVALVTQKQSAEKTQEYLEELAFLAETLGVITVKSFVQKLDQPDTRTYVGKGKLEEIRTFVIDNPVDMVIFDDDLKPSQVRNLGSGFDRRQGAGPESSDSGYIRHAGANRPV